MKAIRSYSDGIEILDSFCKAYPEYSEIERIKVIANDIVCRFNVFSRYLPFLGDTSMPKNELFGWWLWHAKDGIPITIDPKPIWGINNKYFCFVRKMEWTYRDAFLCYLNRYFDRSVVEHKAYIPYVEVEAGKKYEIPKVVERLAEDKARSRYSKQRDYCTINTDWFMPLKLRSTPYRTYVQPVVDYISKEELARRNREKDEQVSSSVFKNDPAFWQSAIGAASWDRAQSSFRCNCCGHDFYKSEGYRVLNRGFHFCSECKNNIDGKVDVSTSVHVIYTPM